MILEKLLNNLGKYDLSGSTEIEIKGISEDSRLIKKGYMFIAVKGMTVDGHDFIDNAVKKGANVVVGEKDGNLLSIPRGVTYVKVFDTRKILGKIASTFYGNPSSKLKVIGVTGTKGKTTTCHLIFHLLSNLDQKTGLISSIKAIVGKKEYDTGFHVTNPDPVTLNKFLHEMVKVKCKYAVIEVSSHGIDQNRIGGIDFEVGVLTNIAPEHLDYHKTFENYKKTKLSFINSAKKKIIAPKNTELNLLPGKFNNLNLEAALKTVELFGFDRSKALKTLEFFSLPEGRMMQVPNLLGLNIIIDFAHNPSSLEALLSHLRNNINAGRLITIFGCASERDETKRPVMGEISGKLSDVSIFTAEDPRREDINKINSEIAAGAKKLKLKELNYRKYKKIDGLLKGVYFSIPERGEAITFAINTLANKGDTIAICGKGHEKSMSYNGTEYPWSDLEAVKLALKGKVYKINRKL